MDGAMGTELQRAGLRSGESCELWNLKHPERVQAIHQAYIDAGAEVLLTNTFQASIADTLHRRGNREPPSAIRRAAELAFSVCGRRPFVLQAVGPVFSADGSQEVSDLKSYDARPVDPEIDAILFETFSMPRVRYLIRKTGDCPALLSLTFLRTADNKLKTRSGHTPEWFATRAERWGAAALGVNCGRDIGMEEVIEIVRRYRDHTDLPLFARPNAGTPVKVGRRWIHRQNPEMMADRLPELLQAGVQMVGGCCGTTPEHIAAFKRVIDAWNKRER